MKNIGMLLVTALLLIGLLAGCAPAVATGSDLMNDNTPAPSEIPNPHRPPIPGRWPDSGGISCVPRRANEGNLLVTPPPLSTWRSR